MNTKNVENKKTVTENTPKKDATQSKKEKKVKKVKKEETIDLWAVCGCRACNT